ncbi:threonine--tRNA ligase [bacterium]|nr:threonine--tRNA ligase [bacterium]
MPVIAKRDVDHEEDSRLHALRHSASHLMAQAVLELFPGTKLAIGPPIEDGFYYDFDTEHRFTPEDLPKIEERMREIAKKKAPFERIEKSREDAEAFLREHDETYKLELLEGIPADEKVTFYESGGFIDLCAGPHIDNAGEIRHFKLLKIAGAYWRGDEKRQMLQRIYGTAWENAEELEAYLKRVEEAERRDHRKLGPELDLFHFYDEAGPGLPFYSPRGSRMLHEIQSWMYDEHLKRGYQPVTTPHILKPDLWKVSGHLEHYLDDMFFVKDMEGGSQDGPLPGIMYGIKPMNCPGHMLIYQNKTRSYRDLPLRLFEFGTVYRNERSGVLHGMLRVRYFTQDDAHHFCTPEQYQDEVKLCLDFCFDTWDTFGFDYTVGLKTRPDEFLGSPEIWDMAEAGLKKVLDERGIPYYIQEKDAVFYGPKVDFNIRDSLGREWQGSTVQLDFNLPKRFGLEYIDSDGSAKEPVMIHRAILGSFERFIGLLVEDFNGAFPLWCAPEQVRILTITDAQLEFASSVQRELAAAGLRVELDGRSEKLGFKIREATMQKVPYALIVGKKEVQTGTVSVRGYFDGDLGQMLPADLVSRLRDEIADKVARRKE